jgi:hypothetical protein
MIRVGLRKRNEMGMDTKAHLIKIFRANGFTCIPIPKYADSVKEQKAADYRIKNRVDQPILESENYAVIPTKDKGTIWLDFDHKELFRDFAEKNIENGYMVIETPNGWHIPVKGLAGIIKKVMLYQKLSKHEKQIVDIQGPLHYVVGCGSDVFDVKQNKRCYYENRGSEKIWDAKGMFFDDLVDHICRKLDLELTSSKESRKPNYEMRQRFKNGLPPTDGTSNDYFLNAAVQCHSKEWDLTKDEAIIKIKEIYDKWENKTRGWDNILDKIDNAYAGKQLDSKGGRNKKEDSDELDSDILAENILTERRIFSDEDTKVILENVDGYLVNITNKLQKQIGTEYKTLTERIFNDIKFKLVSRADDIPATNDDLKVFDNGIWNEKSKLLLSKETDEIASMGFKGYKYLERIPENLPHKFMKVLFENVAESEHPRIRAALKSALTPRLDSRMTVIHGRSRVGKSAGMTILYSVLNRNSEYAMTVELSQLDDHFIKAKIIGKTLIILSELPKTIRDFAGLKSMTGETQKTERGFHKDAETFTNMIKIIATTNNLVKIPEEEKNAFYSARLSLVHNTRIEPYEHTEDFEKDIVEEEGEKIISWIINMTEEECQYEDRHTVASEWEGLAAPELDYMLKYWEYGAAAEPIPIMKIKKDFESKYNIIIPSIKLFIKNLEELGYYISKNAVHDIVPIIQKQVPQSQRKFQSDDD